MSNEDVWVREQGDRSATAETTIEDVEISSIEFLPFIRFVGVFVLGIAFFVFPIPSNNTVTVPFDIFVGMIEQQFAQEVLWLSWGMVGGAALLTTATELHRRDIVRLDDATAERLHMNVWSTSSVFWVMRLLGVLVATAFMLSVGPSWLLDPAVSDIIWGTLVLSIVIIIPLGSIFVNLLVECGALEFVGMLSRPVMKPLFRVPGRSALDAVASWAGSFAIGFYLTRKVFDRGGYDKRDVFIICSCFGTGSIGTIGVFAAAFKMLHIFPLIILSYLLAIVATAAVAVRVPPISRVPREYITEPNVEMDFHGTPVDYVRLAVSEAVEESRGTFTLKAAWDGLIDGLELTATFLGTVLTIGATVLVIYHNTMVFQTMAAPLEPLIALFGIPDAGAVASALLLGFADLYVGALTAVGLAAKAKFFVLLVVSGQILFLSASAPVMMDMFDDIPVRFRDVLAIFVSRTLILIPVSAAITHAVGALGLL